ncbi:sigma-70 family RNA polymerase sigma factor [Marinilabiliaceae bacterium JC017]|nr:sigma-70 family RNA polymerase sigma factor [Marinilabiliaceae bacterium JC017]
MVRINDNHIIKKVRQGEVTAYAQLIDKYQNMVYSLAYNIVKHKEDAEEIAQDAFFKAYRSLDKFKGDSEFSTWLYRIVHNTAISKLRVRKPAASDLDSKDVLQYEMHNTEANLNRLEVKERKLILKKALNRLKEDVSFLMIMYYYKELSIEEIATQTGLSASNVKVKIHRGRKHLYEELHHLLKEELNTIL